MWTANIESPSRNIDSKRLLVDVWSTLSRLCSQGRTLQSVSMDRKTAGCCCMGGHWHSLPFQELGKTFPVLFHRTRARQVSSVWSLDTIVQIYWSVTAMNWRTLLLSFTIEMVGRCKRFSWNIDRTSISLMWTYLTIDWVRKALAKK